MTDPGADRTMTAESERDSGPVPVRPGHPTEVAGRYRILSRIGDGGMGVVYKAEHVLSKKKLAIKLLHPHLSHGKQAVERFRREVSAAADIDHPGIVQVFDAGMDSDGTFYMAMELLHGHSLATELKRDWPGTRRSLELILELCEPLARAHKKGFIHRDLKPDNVFLARDPETGAERVKLLDFGLTRELGKKGTTESGITFGTPEYMAPEQSMSAKNAGTASDVWSVGVMLYELLSGEHPFTGDSPNAIMVAAIKDAHVPLEERAPHVPRAICEVVEKTLRKSVDKRIQTAGELSGLLHQAIDEAGPLDDQRPKTTHRMAEHQAPSEDDAAPDMTGIPAADDAAIAKRLGGQRQISTGPVMSTPEDTRARFLGAAVAAVVTIALVLGLGVWATRGSDETEMSATPLTPESTTPPSTTVVAPVPPPITELPPATEVLPPASEVPPSAAEIVEASPDTPPATELGPTEATEPGEDTPPPATETRHAPRGPALAALTPEESGRARDCLSHNDFACAVSIYRGSSDPHDLRRVIDALEHLGRHREALGAMRDFVRRFPRASETSGYRTQLAAAGM
ncbi:MAG: protein kinase [Sandaracinus sp.]